MYTVDDRLENIEKENFGNAERVAIENINVKKEMESYDDYTYNRVHQPVNTCDENMENETAGSITLVELEENMERVIDKEGRSGNMEEKKEESDEVKMTVEEEEVVCQKEGNSLSEVAETEDAGSPDHEICNGNMHVQNNALQTNVQGLQQLRQDSGLDVPRVNEDKEKGKEVGISERKTRKFAIKDKNAETQPSKPCGDKGFGRKSRNLKPTSAKTQPGQQKKQGRHKCDACGYSTNRKSSLTYHMHTHTHEKPFVCTVCNKSFTQQGSLNVHKRTKNCQDRRNGYNLQ